MSRKAPFLCVSQSSFSLCHEKLLFFCLLFLSFLSFSLKCVLRLSSVSAFRSFFSSLELLRFLFPFFFLFSFSCFSLLLPFLFYFLFSFTSFSLFLLFRPFLWFAEVVPFGQGTAKTIKVGRIVAVPAMSRLLLLVIYARVLGYVVV